MGTIILINDRNPYTKNCCFFNNTPLALVTCGFYCKRLMHKKTVTMKLTILNTETKKIQEKPTTMTAPRPKKYKPMIINGISKLALVCFLSLASSGLFGQNNQDSYSSGTIEEVAVASSSERTPEFNLGGLNSFKSSTPVNIPATKDNLPEDGMHPE